MKQAALDAWFAGRSWQAFPFQHQVWRAMAQGHSGLLHATTGSGKTYAVWMGALLRGHQLAASTKRPPLPPGERVGARGPRSTTAPPLGILWLTPMRALAADTTRALQQPLPELAAHWTVGQRTGDTPSSERARQDKRLPTALVTTPESLSVMLSRASAAADLGQVHTVIVDEWHELIGNKRGVQVQLALARLKRWNPTLVVWGLSATLGNLDEAMAVLLGHGQGRLVQGRVDKALVIDTLLPAEPGRFSWGGHLGAQMLQPVVAEIERSSTTLVFTNTRSQAETWYQLLLQERPEWAGVVALHHGSLAKEVREWVEAGLKTGQLKAVVATSSLDLGVDFLPVERVLQIGSAKGVARLLQRAGRSGHAPGRPSRVTLVPTNTLELVEAAAAREAAQAGRIEQRHSPEQPFDVLVQHLVTVALGGGFAADLLPGTGPGAEPDPAQHTALAMYEEVRQAHAYRALGREDFDWALAFVARGGSSLGAYPDYHRVAVVDGVWRVPDAAIARRHRMAIGTIVSEASMTVKYLSGATIGSIEEGFIARLRKGDCFVFAGRLLEYLRTRDMTAYVQKSTRKRGAIPAWAGGKMPLSTELAEAVLRQFEAAAGGRFNSPEMRAAQPMLETQARLSQLPTPHSLLVEQYRSREGHHLYLYPFAGRNVHLGLASLLAWRLSQHRPNTFSLSVNDLGFELLSAEPVDTSSLFDHRLFSTEGLMDDVLHSLNSGELAQRRFREIARVAGLVSSGFPGQPRSNKQLQASSSLFYEVFRKYDAGNLLLGQAEREVLSQELDIDQLGRSLAAMTRLPITAVQLDVPSPMSLPLMVERLREQLSTEKLGDRLQRMLKEAQAVIDRPPTRPARPTRPAPE